MYPDENVNILVPLLQAYKLVVVYDADHKLIGQVSAGDLLKKYQPDDGISSAIEKVVTIDSEERVVHLRRRMLDDKITRFVVSEHEKYTGIVTETDVAIAMRKFREAVDDNHQDHRIRNMLVKDIMSAPLVSVERTATAADVINDHAQEGFQRRPGDGQGQAGGDRHPALAGECSLMIQKDLFFPVSGTRLWHYRVSYAERELRKITQ